MHIPDGLIWPPILAIGWLLSLAFIAVAIKKVKGEVLSEKISTMAVLAAGIFVAQMLNFPVAGGTTGHLLGATLATLIVGPWSAIIVMSVVIVIQGLMFGDGGILAMGLNLTNMAIIPVAISWVILRRTFRFRAEIPAFMAAFFAVLAAAILCALELAISHAGAPGEYGIIWSISIPMILLFYAIVAIGEGIISSAVIAYFLKVSPEILHTQHVEQKAVAH